MDGRPLTDAWWSSRRGASEWLTLPGLPDRFSLGVTGWAINNSHLLVAAWELLMAFFPPYRHADFERLSNVSSELTLRSSSARTTGGIWSRSCENAGIMLTASPLRSFRSETPLDKQRALTRERMPHGAYFSDPGGLPSNSSQPMGPARIISWKMSRSGEHGGKKEYN